MFQNLLSRSPSQPFTRAAFTTILFALLTVAGFGQLPRVYFKFDGNLTDSSTQAPAIITSVTATGFSPAYTTDRFGVASKALNMPGAGALQLIASSAVGNSNQALGLRNAGGTNTSFTLAAWVKFNSVSLQWYNTIFGNLGSGAGTLHAGTGINVAVAHFGFDSNDVNAAITPLVAAKWYHMAFVYNSADTSQRIYINGVPEVVRTGVTDTIKIADLLLGNWGTATDASNDLRGALDDVVVYNVALSAGKIQALYNNVSPTALPATYSGPKLPGTAGGIDFWGVREIKAYPGILYTNLVNVDQIINTYAVTPGGTVANYTAPVVNFVDPQSIGNLGAFLSEANFATNTGGDDDNFLMLAKGAVRIAIEDDYTFGFIGDEGSRLRILNQTFISSSSANNSAANPVAPAHNGDAIYWENNTTNSGTLGVVHLVPGDYNLEYVYWENTGTASCEVFAARGAKTVIDSTFQLIGNTAAGGLPLVRDPDSLPQVTSFTANGGNSLFVLAGSPATFTLAWLTNAVPTSVSIDQGIGAVAQSGSMVLASPAVTTTYTITAVAGADTATKTVTVYVDAPPNITTFTANDTTVVANTAVTLSWTVEGASTLTLNPGGIDVTGLTSKVVNPTVTTTYTLVATNSSGSSQKTVTVNVGVVPTISSFVVTDPSPLYGAETTLSWNVPNATSLSINQGIGAVPPPTGAVSIVPLQTTTYTMTALNDYGSSTANATITVATPIGVSTTGFTARRVFATAATPLPFANQSYLQSALSLLGTGPNTGQNELNEATQTGFQTLNFADGVDGDFTAGNNSFPGSGSSNYAVQITGTLVVNTPGQYTFVVNSASGCRLRVDGQDIIVDDSSHSPGDNTGSIDLSKPTVSVEVIAYGVSGSTEVELGWIRPNLSWQLIGAITPAAPIVRNAVLISEFMADNNKVLLDEDATYPDWIEVWNSTNATVNLGTYYLTDDAAVPNKWAFPAWTLAANKYLLAFASLKDRRPAQAVAGQDNPGTVAQPHLHTNFKLSKLGGYLALTKDNGSGGFTVVSVFSNYPPQKQDISYGSSDAEGYIGYMEVPTPGGTNAATVIDFVKDTVFSQNRGRYSAAFNLSITTATPGATIRYTTDGTPPDVVHGTAYTAPILISGTTAVRAAAFKPGWKSTNVDTETYLFVDDIVSQSAGTATALGFPTTAVNGQTFRYGMTLANVTAGGGTLAALKSALAAAPSICMTTDVQNLVNPATGIYVNPGQHDLFWERPVSLEYINTAGTSEFQINCGARIRGGFSRSTGNPKHAFHMYFRGSLYDGNLNYKIFGNSGASTFSQIDMRCEENYSWSFQTDAQNSLMREEWGRITQLDTGQPGSRTGYFHLYINGLYWGIYNWEERTEASYGETYLSGSKDNIDVVKSAGGSGNPSYSTEMTDGNFAAWQSLNTQCIALKNDVTSEASRTAKYMQMRGLNANGTPNGAYPVLLDVDNLIDYLLVTFYDGSFDAPLSTFLSNGSNNWFGVRDRVGTRGFAFFIHDNEHGLDTGTNSYNRVGPWGASGSNNWGQGEYGTRETFIRSNPQYLHELLAYSAEYRQRFADRVQKHFFNGGALTTANALARLNALAAQVDPMIHAEAARWGSVTLNLNRNSWLTAKTTITNCINTGGTVAGGQTNFGTQSNGRNSLLIQQFQGYQDPVGTAKPLAATLLAPTYSGNFGGAVASPYNFTITNPNGATGTIYYTTNGVDPRDIGGGINAGALTGASPISVSLTTTSTVRSRIYNGGVWSALTEAQYLVGSLATSANLVISKIHYNPAGAVNLTQFVELMNIGAQTIDLTGVQFTLGIQYSFAPGTLLASGARVLIVRDNAAFTAAYPTVPAGQIAGIFANSSTLDTGGERLQLVGQGSVIIRDFSYNNKDPWPESPDGAGPCLVLLRPTTNPDHSLGANWRASTTAGGAPTTDDSLLYSAWATSYNISDPLGTGDADGDGLTNLTEYALGSNPQLDSPGALPAEAVQAVNVGGVVSNYLTLTYTRAIGRDNVSYLVESSTDLATWTPAVIVGAPNFNNNGTETLTYRHPNPLTANPRQYLRLRITKLP